jgi:hypothetical protein
MVHLPVVAYEEDVQMPLAVDAEGRLAVPVGTQAVLRRGSCGSPGAIRLWSAKAARLACRGLHKSSGRETTTQDFTATALH